MSRFLATLTNTNKPRSNKSVKSSNTLLYLISPHNPDQDVFAQSQIACLLPQSATAYID